MNDIVHAQRTSGCILYDAHLHIYAQARRSLPNIDTQIQTLVHRQSERWSPV